MCLSVPHPLWQDAELVEHLIQSYPKYIKIKELPLETGGNHEKVQTCMPLCHFKWSYTLYIGHAVAIMLILSSYRLSYATACTARESFLQNEL